MNKITVIGSGSVGSTIAYTLTVMGIASEIVMIDINQEKSLGEALDIRQGVPFCNPATVYAGSYVDAKDSDIVVITSGVARKPGQSRLDLAQTNVNVLKTISKEIVKHAPDATYIIVSNPVDVLTYVTIKDTGLPVNQVVGTGTLLDSNRLCQAVAAYCNVDAKNVNAYVFGEHGDACMAPWSLCTVCGMPIKEYCTKVMGVEKEKLEEVLEGIYSGMVAAGAKVIKAKGATFYAIAASTVQLVKALVSDTDTILSVSTLLNGEYGASNLCTGVLCKVGGSGVKEIINMPLTEEEQKLFSEKLASLDNTFNALNVR
jgi:L-lactate dehydrogenase